MDKDSLRDFVDFEVDPEDWDRFLSRRNGALLGSDIVTTLKDKYVWETGKEFVLADLNGLSLFMAGVFTPRDPTYRSVILTDRVFLQEVDDRRGIANQILVKLEDRGGVGEALRALKAMDFPVKIHAEPADEAVDKAMEDLNDMLIYAAYVIAFTCLVILLCLANTISMATIDRTREIGVLRALGFERGKVLSMLLAEAAGLSLAGGLLGCTAAFLLINFGTFHLSIEGFTVPLEVRPFLLLLGFGASILVGIAGGLLPALRAARANIVSSLREAE